MNKLEAIKMVEGMQLPPALKAAAALAVSFMDEKTLIKVFEGAQDAVTKLKAGDASAAEESLAKLGLPRDAIKQLLEKVNATAERPNG